MNSKKVLKPSPVSPATSKMVVVKEVTKRHSVGQAGDPRFLERIAWCIEQRCKIFGLVKERPTNVGVQVNMVPPEFYERLAGRAPIVDPLQERLKQLNVVDSNEERE